MSGLHYVYCGRAMAYQLVVDGVCPVDALKDGTTKSRVQAWLGKGNSERGWRCLYEVRRLRGSEQRQGDPQAE